MAVDDGLITAYRLDGRGGGTEIGWSEIREWSPDQGILWVHLDFTHPEAQRWMKQDSGLDEVLAESMLVDDVRPRSVVTQNGLVVALRAVNLNPGADPEDMVSVRMWIENQRIITLRKRKLLSIDDLRSAIASGSGPTSPGTFLVELTDRIVSRMADVVSGVEETVDELEEQVATTGSRELRLRVASARREAIMLRRYLAPQRDAMARLYSERVEWLDEHDRMRLRELADRTLRYIEDLDAARERAGVTQEELLSRLSEQMNNRMYVLSLVAALFLPLGFVTGLLGINVGGIPGTEFKWAFVVVCVVLVLLAMLQFWIFRRDRWL